MKTATPKICLFGYVVIMLGFTTFSSIPGNLWPWVLAMSLLLVVPLILGTRWYRLAAGVFLILALAASANDYREGKIWYARRERMIEQLRAKGTPNQSTDPALSSGTPAAGQPARHP